MSTTMPTRIDADLFEAAKVMGDAMSRSAAQQVNHWARIGRVFEATAGISHRDIVRVLSGQASYDGLTDKEQVLVRALWDEQLASQGAIDMAAEFAAAGITDWVDTDDRGNVVDNQRRSSAAKPAKTAAKRARSAAAARS
jgi:hypothetical protein